MQLSKALSVQRAGDIVGVVGGVATIVFAVCTAELPDASEKAKPGLAVLAPFADENKGDRPEKRIPEHVWRYMARDQHFVEDMRQPVVTYHFSTAAVAAAPPPKKKLISCHVNAKPDNAVTDVAKRLSDLEKKIGDMTDGMASLLTKLGN
jgi:hypothetical protein